MLFRSYVALFWLGIWFVSSVVGGILETSDREQRRQAMYRNMPMQRFEQSMDSPDEYVRQQRTWYMARQKAQEQFQAQEIRAAKGNWRPLVSYTANLSRVGQHLLGTNASWEKISQLQPPAQRDQFLLDFMGPQYPWTWSAGVLLMLFGLSACILNLQVKSLDRLK